MGQKRKRRHSQVSRSALFSEKYDVFVEKKGDQFEKVRKGVEE